MIMRIILIISLAFILLACQKKNNDTNSEASEKVVTSGNPLFEGWYADPEVAIFDNTYWIFPTYSARFEKQVFMDAFSSKNLVNWQKHESIIDTAAVTWANRAMWAPCTVKKDGKYYLFFGANDLQTPESQWYKEEEHKDMVGGIGIGMSDNPAGPYEDYLGKPLIGEVHNGAQPIDQFVFKDADGQYYMIYGGWGHCNIVKLNSDFTALEAFEDGTTYKEITPDGYVEGPVMFVRNGWYYLMWSEGNWTDGSYQVAYGRSKSLLGPFDKTGVVLKSNPDIATGAGHHSVLHIPDTDDWYAVYHRRPIPNEDRDHRVTCIDRMYFNEEGEIEPIQITFEGVKARVLSN